MMSSGQKHRRYAIESDDAVRSRIGDESGLRRRHELGVVWSQPLEGAEWTEAKQLGAPHVHAAERTAGQSAPARPERLHVSNQTRFAEYGRRLSRRFIAFQQVSAASLLNGGESGVGSINAGPNRIMAALDSRHVYKSRRTTDQCSTGKNQFRHGLQTAFGDRPRAIGDTPSALQHWAN